MSQLDKNEIFYVAIGVSIIVTSLIGCGISFMFMWINLAVFFADGIIIGVVELIFCIITRSDNNPNEFFQMFLISMLTGILFSAFSDLIIDPLFYLIPKYPKQSLLIFSLLTIGITLFLIVYYGLKNKLDKN